MMTTDHDHDHGATIRTARLDGTQWKALLDQVKRSGDRENTEPRKDADPSPSPLSLLLRHGSAPVRASLVATAGSRGSIARMSLVDDEVLVILQAIAEREGRVLMEPGVELRLAGPEAYWLALQAAIPSLDLLRAPASVVGHEPQQRRGSGEERPSDSGTPEDGAPWPGATLDGADAILQFVVEAWPEPGRLGGFWSRLWAVEDGTLFDLERRDGVLERTERPVGAVAAEFQWAIVGATGIAAARPDDDAPEDVQPPEPLAPEPMFDWRRFGSRAR